MAHSRPFGRTAWDLPSTQYGRIWVPSARKAAGKVTDAPARASVEFNVSGQLKGCRTSTAVNFSRREYSPTVSIYLPRMMCAASVLKLRKRIQLSRSDERLKIVMHRSSGQIARWIQKPSCSEPRGGFYAKLSWGTRP